MKALVKSLDAGSRATSYMLGGFVLVLAAAVMATSMDPAGLAARATDVFGYSFLVLMGALIFISLFCWARVLQGDGGHRWLEAGLQAANGITTLALTFTLLGISLGIGTLAEQTLTPETVQDVIKDLTDNFSLAFMTTVVGLPTSAVLRTLLMVTHAGHQDKANDNPENAGEG